jgi:hypothetical protein
MYKYIFKIIKFKTDMLKLLGSKFVINNSISYYSTATVSSILIENKINKSFKQKIQNLPVQLNTNNLNISTLDRLNLCSNEFLVNFLENLNNFGIKDKHLTNLLKFHDDWSILTREKLDQTFSMFRELAFTSDIYLELITRNPKLITFEKQKLEFRLNEFRQFFTNKHMSRLLIRTPDLLTCNMDSFTYKFTYLFTLMGIDQDEQSRTYVYDHSIEYIRARHLFLKRSGFFEKPNKKGVAKVKNPRLKEIIDPDLKKYLQICTKNLFNIQEFKTFNEYLNEENFEDELLGQRIGTSLQKKIIFNVKQSKYENFEKLD